MPAVMRFECDAAGCGSYVAIDVLHQAGPEQLYDVSAETRTAGRRDMGGEHDGADGAAISVEVAFLLEGWYAGALPTFGTGHLRVLCESHGSVCPACGGRALREVWQERAEQDGGPFRLTQQCPDCEGFGVIEREG